MHILLYFQCFIQFICVVLRFRYKVISPASLEVIYHQLDQRASTKCVLYDNKIYATSVFNILCLAALTRSILLTCTPHMVSRLLSLLNLFDVRLVKVQTSLNNDCQLL
ncbi:hypothetical protein QTP88_005348 [Uroleucon formosanum]